jgi:hypothetical protein
MWGVFPSFQFRVSVAASQKKTRFRYSENGKGTFHGTKQKSASMAFLAIPRATRVSDIAGLVLTKYAMLMAESSSFNLKVMQPRT